MIIREHDDVRCSIADDDVIRIVCVLVSEICMVARSEHGFVHDMIPRAVWKRQLTNMMTVKLVDLLY